MSDLYISQLSRVLLFLGFLVWTCEAAKGGAKSVINRKRQRGPGSSYIGNHHSDDGAEAGNYCPGNISLRSTAGLSQVWGEHSLVAAHWAWSRELGLVSGSVTTSRKEE